MFKIPKQLIKRKKHNFELIFNNGFKNITNVEINKNYLRLTLLDGNHWYYKFTNKQTLLFKESFEKWFKDTLPEDRVTKIKTIEEQNKFDNDNKDLGVRERPLYYWCPVSGFPRPTYY
ncbi:hypothetical protein HOK00_10550 [bacterium]|jgi:hypothetical protein|nr:hypothetical protein [bacterium]